MIREIALANGLFLREYPLEGEEARWPLEPVNTMFRFNFNFHRRHSGAPDWAANPFRDVLQGAVDTQVDARIDAMYVAEDLYRDARNDHFYRDGKKQPAECKRPPAEWAALSASRNAKRAARAAALTCAYEEMWDSLADDNGSLANYTDREWVAKLLGKDSFLDFNKAGLVRWPLHCYDHSGVSMSTRRFHAGWDSGQVGWIIATRELIKEHAFVGDIDKAAKEFAVTVGQYVNGDCSEVRVEDKDYDVVGDCYEEVWGGVSLEDYIAKWNLTRLCGQG